MSEQEVVEAAIRAWEQARKVEEDARKAVFKARDALALANRALDDAGAREDEARSAAIPLMASGDDGPVGWIVDGRFYYRVESLDEIRSLRIANAASESSTPAEPAAEPDGRWTPSAMRCPACGWAGSVRYRPAKFSYQFECDKCGHAWRSATFDERGGGA